MRVLRILVQLLEELLDLRRQLSHLIGEFGDLFIADCKLVDQFCASGGMLGISGGTISVFGGAIRVFSG